jgi:aminoglycoside phosphotransferase (APT) family kinase protein
VTNAPPDPRVDRLERFLAEAAGASAAAVLDLRPLAGGAVQENWRLDAEFAGGPFAGRQQLVLRGDAKAPIPASHARVHEFAILKEAHARGVKVPEPLWLCQDADVLGKAFFVMRRLAGVAAGHRVVKDARLGGGHARLAEALARELARIHAVPPASLGFLAAPQPSPALAAVADYRAYLDRCREPRPALEWGLAWLERNAPPLGELVLCHRDFRTGNYLADERGLVAVLDWEFANIGDAHEDIGWFCARCWRFGADDKEAGGIAAREAFIGAYERACGRRIDRARVRYFEAMAHARWAVIALQQAERHDSGRQPSLELALTGHVVPELELELLRMTEGEE